AAVVPGARTVAQAVQEACPGVRVAVVAGAGHAVPTEAPAALFREVAKLSAVAAASVGAGGGGAASASAAADSGTAAGVGEEERVAKITRFSLEEFSIPMTSPLQLSLCKLTERRGVIVRLEALLPRSPGTGVGREQEERRRVWGVGEVTPLPGFHEETLEEATANL
ncbi:unnamed protein product, partial [Ectocarpus sp. 12 AP-2014]